MSKPNLSILNLSLGSAGTEKVISLLLKKLIDDYNVTLFLIYKERHFTIPKQVEVISLTKKGSKSSLFTKFLDAGIVLWKYNRHLKRGEITYAVSFLPFPNIINGITAIFNPKKKFFISERGFPSNNTSKKLSLYFAKMFYPIFYNRCYKLFSNSIYINKDLKENFGVKIPMDVIYNPIEIPQRKIDPKSLGHELKILKIINVGTLNDRKNQKMIIDALHSLSPFYELKIIGGGPLNNVLEKQIIDTDLSQITLVGGGIKNVNDYLIKSDCFILSSRTEGFPNALLEAMSVGLPCISTNCLSGPLELLNQNKPVEIKEGEFYKATYGILIKSNDSIALANALEYLRVNPKERERYSRLSLIRSKEYDLENIYTIFKQFLIK